MGASSKTVLYENHTAAGGRMVDFAGYLMPVQYAEGIVAEHLWTRRQAGIFDVSHMGRFVFRGAGALGFLQRMLTNDASKLSVGMSQYTIMANEAGGAIDDAYLYRFFDDEYLLVVNAANRAKDLSHLRGHLGDSDDTEMVDVSEELAMISLQGPESEDIVGSLLEEGTLPEAKRNRLSVVRICGTEVLLGRTGYAGEPVGFEMMLASEAAGRIWDAVMAVGAKPVGLGARDTLRLEAGLPLYGHEYGTDKDGAEIGVFACGLAKFAVSFAAEKGDFVGREALKLQCEALARIKEGDFSAADVLPRVVRQIALTGRGIARAGDGITFQGAEAGYVTSGTMVPYWQVADTCESLELTEESGMRAVAMGLLDCRVVVGDRIEIDIRGRPTAAKVVARNLNNRAGRIAVGLVYSE